MRSCLFKNGACRFCLTRPNISRIWCIPLWIVLVDLVGSTKFSAENGNDKMKERIKQPRNPFPTIVLRTCVHVGEVSLAGTNPLSLAVSQTFKMEKNVGASHIVLTNPAFRNAWPTMDKAYRAFSDYGAIVLDGFSEPIKFHRLEVQQKIGNG
jgi:hypothetical protein